MNIKYIYIYITIIFGILLSADMKIGYIDSNRIMQELDEVREVRVQLEKEQRRMEVEMQQMIGRRDSLVQAYELQKILLVDENKRIEKEREIQLLEQSIERFQMEKFGPNGGEIYKLQNWVKFEKSNGISIDELLDNSNQLDDLEHYFTNEEYGIFILTILNNFKSKDIINMLIDVIIDKK